MARRLDSSLQIGSTMRVRPRGSDATFFFYGETDFLYSAILRYFRCVSSPLPPHCPVAVAPYLFYGATGFLYSVYSVIFAASHLHHLYTAPSKTLGISRFVS